jgi:WD40 repeat protein
MKRILPCLILLCYTHICIASLADDPETADGYLTAGEYVSSIRAENNDILIISGGNATTLDVYDFSRIEIYSTSQPLSYTDKRGVYDIHLNDSSTLLFSGGATESLKVGKNAQALLTGGTINLLTIYHYGSMTSSVTIDCKDGWQWLYTAGKVSGITGVWQNGMPFQIEFVNPGSIFPDTWNFVHVIPEPATIALFGLGVIFLRRKGDKTQ